MFAQRSINFTPFLGIASENHINLVQITKVNYWGRGGLAQRHIDRVVTWFWHSISGQNRDMGRGGQKWRTFCGCPLWAVPYDAKRTKLWEQCIIKFLSHQTIFIIHWLNQYSGLRGHRCMKWCAPQSSVLGICRSSRMLRVRCQSASPTCVNVSGIAEE